MGWNMETIGEAPRHRRLSAFRGVAGLLGAIGTAMVEIPVAADQENRFLREVAERKISDTRDTL